MKLVPRIALALAAFAAVLWLPGLLSSGAAGPSGDLALGDLLGRGSWLAFLVAFAGGVLTSLTPCVYPLIPITVSIFGARKAGSRGEAALLSGLYVLGIAVTYSALGVGAALTGQAFGSVMQNGWVVGGVALVLVVMATSMFGAFELALPASLQQRLSSVGGAGRAGAFGMGLVAGVIAAPCTGPVLAAALTFIAAKGSVALGVAIMFPYALGMGLLFFLIGAFSISLPKSGAWMETVKSVFGAALLVMAGAYLKDLIPGLRPLFSAAPGASLVAAAAAALGVLLGALQLSFHGPSRERALKLVGVTLLVAGAVYGAVLGGAAAGARERVRAEGFAWLPNEPEAVALARAQGRPVVIDFWAEWCTACKELDKVVWSDPRVREEAGRFVRVKVDGTDENPAIQAIQERYQVQGMPTVVFIDSGGRPVDGRVVGMVDADEMLQRLRAVR
jgi:thiol:disulfide interchange protein DsbD